MLEHGHADVPQGYEENHSLGDWVNNWRRKMRQWERSDKRDESLNEKMVLLKRVGLNSFIGECHGPANYYIYIIDHIYLLLL